MKILENSDSRLVIEWRPWIHSYVALFFALWFSWEIYTTQPDQATDDPLMFAGAVLLTAFIFVMVYQYGQMTRLSLDRATGTAHILRHTLFGTFHRSIPLREITSASTHVVPGQFPMRGVVMLWQSATGTKKLMVPQVHLFTRTADPAASAISDWLDSARPAA